MPTPGEHHPAFEEYCECIYELREDDVEVIRARIADRLRVSRPSVSEMIRKMEGEDLVSVVDGRVRLTRAGEALAERVVRRHRLAERFLTDILGLSWAEAHREAGRWEHVMSDSVESAMNRVLGSPSTCPHGNPIPGADYVAPHAVRLVEVPLGRRFVVSRIPEELEFTAGMLDFLESTRLMPGTGGVVASAGPDGAVVVDIDGTAVTLDQFASSRILVTA